MGYTVTRAEIVEKLKQDKAYHQNERRNPWADDCDRNFHNGAIEAIDIAIRLIEQSN